MGEKIEIFLNKRNKTLRTESNTKNAFLISGGGTRGVFAIGILKYLFEDNPHFCLQNTSIFGGTSVGSFLACALSLGFTRENTIEMSKIIDLSHLIDNKWLFMLTTYRFLSKGHLYDDSGRKKIIENILEYRIDIINNHLDFPEKITGKNLTFNHLKILINKYPNIYKHLLINAVDINRGQQIFMTTLDNKCDNIKLMDALMASSAIPFVFGTTNIYYYPSSNSYGYSQMSDGLKCHLIDGGVSTNNPTDFFLINNALFNDYNLWLINFTSKQEYLKIDGTISMGKQVLDYLISGKNDIKMQLVEEQFKINTINLHSTDGTIVLYTPQQIEKIINDIYDQCINGKILFD